MGDKAKKEHYVRNKYDVKWSCALTFVAMLGSLMFQIMGIGWLSGWNLFISLLFWLLFWGNYRTLNAEKQRLERM